MLFIQFESSFGDYHFIIKNNVLNCLELNYAITVVLSLISGQVYNTFAHGQEPRVAREMVLAGSVASPGSASNQEQQPI